MDKASIKIFVAGAVYVLLSLQGSTALAQSVSQDLSEPLITENFDNNDLGWPILTNRDNFFIIQKGEYLLERKNTEGQYAALNTSLKIPAVYALKAALKVEKGYAGIIFMVQNSGQGAFIVELSDNKRYRIKQLAGTNYQLLTGDVGNEGWVKLSSLKAGTFNVLQVKVNQNKADIYINNAYITTLSEPNYSPGKAGLMVGPSTRASADYFLVTGSRTGQSGQPDSEESVRSQNTLIQQLKMLVVRLKQENDSLVQANQQLRKKLSKAQEPIQEASPDINK